ncbi:hypothetical protein [Streptomyces sp. NPDC090053]|uniref:hypothetical protein n=1 Tax=Streptomyces sp. NPDC090053 TaxID=3365932 RepID=UPI00381678AD
MAPVGDWTPPACWYEPYSADEFAKDTEDGYSTVANDPRQPSYAKSSVGQFRNIYKDGKYKNYNKDKADQGSWWVATRDPDRWMDDAAQVCNKMPFWVKNGETPQVENAVTPEILAELAYNKVRLPDTEVTLAPADTTKVNLPTWAWLDKRQFKPVSVTAALNAAGVDIQATTTAEPVSLKIDPGTSDATTFPASGECPIINGRIGEPYAAGKADKTPPCGVEYLRSSGNGTYKLNATVTWKIHWTGTGVAGEQPLPDGEFGTTQDVTVQEIQAVNR